MTRKGSRISNTPGSAESALITGAPTPFMEILLATQKGCVSLTPRLWRALRNGAWDAEVICFIRPVMKLVLSLPESSDIIGLDRTEDMMDGMESTASALPFALSFSIRPEVTSPAWILVVTARVRRTVIGKYDMVRVRG